jgi:hypothetical protein
VHTIELHSVALPPAEVQQRSTATDYLYFTRVRKTLAGAWTMVLTLSTLADVVPSEFLDEHRESLRKIRAQSAWSLMVPPGDPRPHQRRDFGMLPKSWDPASAIPAPPRPRLSREAGAARRSSVPHVSTPGNGAHKDVVAAAGAEDLENGDTPPPPSVPSSPATARLKRQKRSRRKRDAEPPTKTYIIAACAMALTLIVIAILAEKYADRWNLFRMHVEPPKVPLYPMPSR